MAEALLSDPADGFIRTALCYAAIHAGLPELLAQGPADTDQLARRGGFRPEPLERLLRGWVAIGLCHRIADGRYHLSPAGAALGSESGSGQREWVQLVVEQYVPAFRHLDATLFDDVLPFELAHGLPPFEYRRTDPHADAVFNSWLASETDYWGVGIAAAHDWRPHGHIVDVAGGEGSLLRSIAARHGDLRLTLFEQPHVVRRLEAGEASARMDLVAGDMFEEIPVCAGLYVLKSVLHDWDDERAVRILSNVRAAMPPGAGLLVIERLLGEAGPHARSTVELDLHMLAVTGGRERTARQFSELLATAGFGPPAIEPTDTPFYLLAAQPE